MNHHKSISAGNSVGAAARYAKTVDYFGQPDKSRDELITEAINYRNKWSRIQEKVVGEIQVTDLGDDRFEARYVLESWVELDTEKRWVRTEAEVTMRVKASASRVGKIASSRGTIYYQNARQIQQLKGSL